MEGFNALGRLIAGIADQAIAVIEGLGEINERGSRPGAAAAAVASSLEIEDPLHEITPDLRFKLTVTQSAAA